ncbi:TPA: hypothetical protein ACWMJU_006656 [Pseudomonas aeruginosa]
MSIKQAVRVAELLHVNPMAIICGVMFHQDPAEAEFWQSVYEQTVRDNDRRQYFPETD